MADQIEQEKVLREPQGVAEKALLDLHRALFPECHRAYWLTQPEIDWPDGWDGKNVSEWDAETIEWTADSIEYALKASGIIE